MLHPDSGDPAATRQSGRGCAFLEHGFEHRLRPAWYGKPVGEDHNRRRSSVHADRVDAEFANTDRLAFNPRVNTGKRTARKPEPIAGSGSIASRISSCARGIACRASRITRGNEVDIVLCW